MRKFLFMIFSLAILSILTACASSDASGNESIVIGVTAGPPEEITNIVKEEAEKEGINLEVVVFNDITTPNRALNSGELDLNMFQAKQFLDSYVEDRKEPIVAIGTTYNSTIGIYSDKYDSIDDIPDGAMLGIFNDAVNRGRSLLLYEEAGLLEVNDSNVNLTLNDIEDNPKNFEFIEIEGPLMLRTLGSIDAGVVASTNAFDQGVDPIEESIYLETRTDYPMVVAAKEENKDNADYKRIVELYHSDTVKEFIEERYKDVIIVTEDPFEFE